MEIKTHNIDNTKVAEIITDKVILRSTEDGLELLGNLYYQGFDKIIIHEKNITPEFFDLRTKIAGEDPSKIRTIPDAAHNCWRLF